VTREEIFFEALNKAHENGYTSEYDEFDFNLIDNVLYFFRDGDRETIGIETILFDREFCRAFFEPIPICEDCKTKLEMWKPDNAVEGEVETWTCFKCNKTHRDPNFWWEYHGQQMFLAKDRLKYIKGFLK